MRPFSIIVSLLVAAALYLMTFERPALLAFADAVAPDAATGPDAAAPATGTVSVVALKSTARTIDSAVLVRGQTEAARAVDVSAETAGRIVSRPLRKGSFVTAGQTLCELDPGTRDAMVAEAEARRSEARARGPEAEARLAEAEARLAEAQINDNAASTLSDRGFASQTRVAATAAAVSSARAAVQAAKSGLEAAGSGVQAADAAVAAARREVDKLTIAAPFDGLLETDTAELGELMSTGAHCATVIQLDPIKLVGFVPETEVDKVRVGAGAQARLATGATVQGRVTFLSRAADDATRTFRTEVEVPNADLAIRDGQTAEIVIRSDGRAAHLLPQSALTLDDDGTLGVRLVGAGDVAQFAPVTPLRDTVDGIWVAGLPDTASVIVVGQEYVVDGVPLAPTWRDSAADPAAPRAAQP